LTLRLCWLRAAILRWCLSCCACMYSFFTLWWLGTCTVECMPRHTFVLHACGLCEARAACAITSMARIVPMAAVIMGFPCWEAKLVLVLTRTAGSVLGWGCGGGIGACLLMRCFSPVGAAGSKLVAWLVPVCGCVHVRVVWVQCVSGAGGADRRVVVGDVVMLGSCGPVWRLTLQVLSFWLW
jgi:hypothetical protein